MNMEKKRCEKRVWNDNVFMKSNQCSRNAVMTAPDGKCYCKQHSPEATAKRIDKKDKEANKKYRTEHRKRHYGYVGEQQLIFLKKL